MTLQLLHSEFPYIRGKCYFIFYQCTIGKQDFPDAQRREGGGITLINPPGITLSNSDLAYRTKDTGMICMSIGLFL
jgi:hypothetical protein